MFGADRITTLQGIAAFINGDMIPPGLLDGLTENAVEQFLRGAAPQAAGSRTSLVNAGPAARQEEVSGRCRLPEGAVQVRAADQLDAPRFDADHLVGGVGPSGRR